MILKHKYLPPTVLAVISIVAYVIELSGPWDNYSEPHSQVVLAAIIVYGAPLLLLMAIIWAVVLVRRS